MESVFHSEIWHLSAANSIKIGANSENFKPNSWNPALERLEPMALARETSEEICRSVNSLEPGEKKYLCYRFSYPFDDEVHLHENRDATRVLR